MTERISITQVDDNSVKESLGERKTPIHEKVFKEYGIKPNTQQNAPLIPIPTSWTQQIIEKNISSIAVRPINKNKQQRGFILLFNSNDEAVDFERQFQTSMFKSINQFIVEQKEKPENYNRNIITTTEIEGLQLHITY